MQKSIPEPMQGATMQSSIQKPIQGATMQRSIQEPMQGGTMQILQGATPLRVMQEPMCRAASVRTMQNPTPGIRPTTSIFLFVHDVSHTAKFAPGHSIPRVPSIS